MPATKKRSVAKDRSTLVYCIVRETEHARTGAVGERSYIGMTHQFATRLRQHNGEIKKGARSTRRAAGTPPWEPLFLVTGFPARKNASQLEDVMHTTVKPPHAYRHHRNPFAGRSGAGRAWQLFWALQREQLSPKAPPTRTLPLTVHWRLAEHLEAARAACPVPWPARVKHARLRPDQLPDQRITRIDLVSDSDDATEVLAA